MDQAKRKVRKVYLWVIYLFNYVYEFIYINELYLWIIYAYTCVYVKVDFKMDNIHDLMVNGLRSR